jgi:hypothetical protein
MFLEGLSIGQAADACGVSIGTLSYYASSCAAGKAAVGDVGDDLPAAGWGLVFSWVVV